MFFFLNNYKTLPLQIILHLKQTHTHTQRTGWTLIMNIQIKTTLYMTKCVYQRCLHSKSRTTWLICGAYVLTCSMCLIFVFHLLPVMSDKRVQMRLAVSEAQAVHACISLWILREDSSIEEPFSTSIDECSSGSWRKGVVTFWWICSIPPVSLFSSRHATDQPSSELGMRPKFTRSARSHNGS